MATTAIVVNACGEITSTSSLTIATTSADEAATPAFTLAEKLNGGSIVTTVTRRSRRLAQSGAKSCGASASTTST